MEKARARNMNEMIKLIALIIWIALFTVAFIFGCRVLERKRIPVYNARLEELCEWIDGYEIVNAEYNPSLSMYSWTITKLNNGKEETITIEEAPFERICFNTCPISSFIRISADNKYHIMEDNDKLVIYYPNDYYNTVSESKYSSK